MAYSAKSSQSANMELSGTQHHLMRSQWNWWSPMWSHLNVRNPVRNWQNPCCPVKQQRLLKTCKNTKRVKVTVWEHIFVSASLCGWAVLFSLEIFNFLQTNHLLPPPQLSFSSPLLWSNCYLNVSTWLLFWKKKWCIIFITNYCT